MPAVELGVSPLSAQGRGLAGALPAMPSPASSAHPRPQPGLPGGEGEASS